jgi:hypothetical protein
LLLELINAQGHAFYACGYYDDTKKSWFENAGNSYHRTDVATRWAIYPLPTPPQNNRGE